MGYLLWKITILCQKILFFPILGGAPPWIRPWILLPFLNIVCYSKLLLTKYHIRHWHVTPTFAFKALHTWYRKWSQTYKNMSTSTKNVGYTLIFPIHFISLLFLVFKLFFLKRRMIYLSFNTKFTWINIFFTM